jgi:hypothetical protein
VDGIKRGVIAFQPFEIELGDLRGAKELSIVVYGNRYNTFGHLHLDNDALNWCGPNAWRSEGDQWTYFYQTVETGINGIPELIVKA